MRPDLPGILSEIAEAAGEDAAIALAQARGGTDFHIPRSAPSTQLAEIVGEVAAQKIIDAIGHGKVKLPSGGWRTQNARRKRAKDMLLAGHSVRDVALRLDLDERTVKRYSAALDRADDRQLNLLLDD